MNNFTSILQLAKEFDTDLKCRKYLERIMWDNVPVCPHCGNEDICAFKDGRRFKCKTCKKQFTVTVGTIFEGSHIPLQKWFIGSYLLLSHSKGISSIQLSKDLGITQKSAWYMAHRLRYAIRQKSFQAPLTGIVEMDESFVGGREHNRHVSKKGVKHKKPVFGMVERGGQVRTQTVRNIMLHNLLPVIAENVDNKAVIMTDSAPHYKLIFNKQMHFSVNHTKGEYVRGNAHTNTIEGFWSLFKRGYVGIYHMMSEKHLDKYLDEFEFRYNNMQHKGQERLNSVLGLSNGYLSYKELIAKK